MAGGVNTHALARSIRAMTLGTLRDYQDARERFARFAMGELDQQYQLPIAGVVGQVPAWSTVTITFDAPFVDGYDDRRAHLIDPLFTFGTILTAGTPAFVSCHVRRWITDADGNYTGAELEVGIHRPGVTTPQPFAGELHLNFQGYGMPEPDDYEGDLG